MNSVAKLKRAVKNLVAAETDLAAAEAVLMTANTINSLQARVTRCRAKYSEAVEAVQREINEARGGTA